MQESGKATEMAFRFRRQEAVDVAVRRMARQELRGGIAELVEQQPNPHDAVHEFRKRCKRLRGLLRLVRPHLGDRFAAYNGQFRDLARTLSQLRDSQAKIEALDRLRERSATEANTQDFLRIREYLVAHQAASVADEPLTSKRIQPIVRTLRRVAREARDWEIPDRGFNSLRVGLETTYRDARRAMDRAYADGGDHGFHDWRKQVKYHWHHTLMLSGCQPLLLRAHARLADELAEYLGQDHDYAVLRDFLQEKISGIRRAAASRAGEGDSTAGACDTVVSAIGEEQARLRCQMRSLGANLLAESPSRFVDRCRSYWDAWRANDDR